MRSRPPSATSSTATTTAVTTESDTVYVSSDGLYLAAETDLSTVLAHIAQVQPDLVVVDSVQTIGAAGIDGFVAIPQVTAPGIQGAVLTLPEALRTDQIRELHAPPLPYAATARTSACRSRVTARCRP